MTIQFLRGRLLEKGTIIPCSKTESYYTVHPGQRAVACRVTECATPETDLSFVKIRAEAKLPLPPGRPAGQEILITFAYDDNQIMYCTFRDAEDGEEVVINIEMSKSGGPNGHDTD